MTDEELIAGARAWFLKTPAPLGGATPRTPTAKLVLALGDRLESALAENRRLEASLAGYAANDARLSELLEGERESVEAAPVVGRIEATTPNQANGCFAAATCSPPTFPASTPSSARCETRLRGTAMGMSCGWGIISAISTTRHLSRPERS